MDLVQIRALCFGYGKVCELGLKKRLRMREGGDNLYPSLASRPRRLCNVTNGGWGCHVIDDVALAYPLAQPPGLGMRCCKAVSWCSNTTSAASSRQYRVSIERREGKPASSSFRNTCKTWAGRDRLRFNSLTNSLTSLIRTVHARNWQTYHIHSAYWPFAAMY